MKNAERITNALAILRDTMAPWLCQKIRQTVPEYRQDDTLWWNEAVVQFASRFDDEQYRLSQLTDFNDRADALDISACCNILLSNWRNIFRNFMSSKVSSWAKLVINSRNDVAHIGGNDISDADTTSALDTIAQLAGEIDPETEQEIRAIYREHVYGTSGASTEGSNAQAASAAKPVGVMTRVPVEGLKPWRSVIEPHPDVAQGRYKNAEFAADLAQVARGEGAYEYRDPVEFFSRTYVTEGMKGLLVQALRRVGELDGEPVIQLKTAFGGGKTHSMLALYHMLRGRASIKRISNLQSVLAEAGIESLPICRVAVLVGTSLDPSKSKRPGTGITVNTLWGEMAWQLANEAGNPKLYDIIKEADKKGVSPGSVTLKNLFDACGPCVVLIDELVAYAKKLWQRDDLPAGTFDNLISFIQEITEAARASKNSLVVASIPESNVEIGGEGGQQALEAIEHTFGRMESIWKPVGANEGFEIVRRRLFLDCRDEAARDASCVAFSQMYQDNSADFPSETKEVDYLTRMKNCYPIHPEIFDRLYEDWATIERFQKTRGVLRLMAAVVHKLWMAQDASLMIMPGSVNLDESNIRDELTRYVGDAWNPIVDHEVDGKQSIPYQKDQQTPRFGRIMAARRVARTIMLGSAPSDRSNSIRGIENSRIRLGAIQPGENIATFNDALNTLQGALTYLYSNPSADRYWYDTRPTLRKTAEDRASQRSEEEVEMEIERRLRQIRRERPFARVHICPESSMDVSDDEEIGIVILKYRQTYKHNAATDTAIMTAENILNNRGNSPRTYRNMLAFIAPDASMSGALREEVKRYLAWKSIKEDSEDLNLDAAQNRETENNLSRSNRTVDDRILETYCHLLVPYIDRQQDLKTIIWEDTNIRGGQDSILVKAARKMQQSEQLITTWAPALLKMQLDNLLWRESMDISIGELWKMLCTYCYLPRLANFSVLQEAIQNGVNSEDYFAYAEGKSDGRYTGLKFNQYVGFIDRSGYIVQQVAALKQLAAERQKPEPPVYPDYPDRPVTPEYPDTPPRPDNPTNPPVTPPKPTARHFSLNTTLDNTRVVKNVSNLMDEVINHLVGVDGASVSIRILVEADMPDGTPVPIVRTVTENCHTLHVEDFGFDD